MTREVVVPAAALPDDPIKRDRILQDYFCELLADARREANEWHITLRHPDKHEYYVDPELATGLRWWSDTIGPVEPADLLLMTHQADGFFLAFSDAWTLYAWSEYLSRFPQLPPSVIILHADDHDDLMAPRLVRSADGWQDLITRGAFDLRDPQSVLSSIRSGAIGMGSFFAPALHTLPHVTLRHFTHSAYATERPHRCTLRKVLRADDLLRPGAQRPAILLETEVPPGLGTHEYLATATHAHVIPHDVQVPIFLHIDMDCFSNRYNGDSDRLTVAPKYDPGLPAVLEDIAHFFDALAPVAHHIVSCTIALSAGFFPAEYWEPAIHHITTRINQLRQQHRWYA